MSPRSPRWALAPALVALLVQLVVVYAPSGVGTPLFAHVDKLVHVAVFALPVFFAVLARLPDGALVVNVARGPVVDTDALVAECATGRLRAALDVTDPEPLPAGHPLWSMPNCIITPHVGNTPAMAAPLLAERITTNVRRYARGEELIGPVDADLGY